MGELDEEKERQKPQNSDRSVPTGDALAADVDESMAISRNISIRSEDTSLHSNSTTVADFRTENREMAPSVLLEVGPPPPFHWFF